MVMTDSRHLILPSLAATGPWLLLSVRSIFKERSFALTVAFGKGAIQCGLPGRSRGASGVYGDIAGLEGCVGHGAVRAEGCERTQTWV